MKIEMGLHNVAWAFGVISWAVMVLAVVILRCTRCVTSRQEEIRNTQDQIRSEVAELKEAVEAAFATESREARAAAITAALDNNNITSINRR